MNTNDSLKEWRDVNKFCINLVQDIKSFIRDYVRDHEKNRKRLMLISILARCNTNLISIALLTKYMVVNKKPYTLKLSIGILLRNCYMDALLGLYLSEKDENHIEEIAEVLNADYVKALFDQFEVYRDKVDDIGSDCDFLEHMYTMTIEDNYLHYLELNEDIEEIKPGEERHIWKTTPKKRIRTLIPENKVKQELDLKGIWKNLKDNEIYADCANNLYAYYKYFSQYEHFSEAGYGNTVVSSEDDNVDMVKAVERLAESIDLIEQKGLLKN